MIKAFMNPSHIHSEENSFGQDASPLQNHL